jgi:hypothetical protein
MGRHRNIPGEQAYRFDARMTWGGDEEWRRSHEQTTINNCPIEMTKMIILWQTNFWWAPNFLIIIRLMGLATPLVTFAEWQEQGDRLKTKHCSRDLHRKGSKCGVRRSTWRSGDFSEKASLSVPGVPDSNNNKFERPQPREIAVSMKRKVGESALIDVLDNHLLKQRNRIFRSRGREYN